MRLTLLLPFCLLLACARHPAAEAELLGTVKSGAVELRVTFQAGFARVFLQQGSVTSSVFPLGLKADAAQLLAVLDAASHHNGRMPAAGEVLLLASMNAGIPEVRAVMVDDGGSPSLRLVFASRSRGGTTAPPSEMALTVTPPVARDVAALLTLAQTRLGDTLPAAYHP